LLINIISSDLSSLIFQISFFWIHIKPFLNFKINKKIDLTVFRIYSLPSLLDCSLCQHKYCGPFLETIFKTQTFPFVFFLFLIYAFVFSNTTTIFDFKSHPTCAYSHGFISPHIICELSLFTLYWIFPEQYKHLIIFTHLKIPSWPLCPFICYFNSILSFEGELFERVVYIHFFYCFPIILFLTHSYQNFVFPFHNSV
jgi:hypothetical protein